MARPWVKLSTSILDHFELDAVSPLAFKSYVKMLALAGQVDDNGRLGTLDEVAYRLRMTADELIEVLGELNGRVERDGETLLVRDWTDYQPPRTAADRMRDKRQRDAGPACDAPVTQPLRNSDAPEEKREDTTAQSDDCTDWDGLERMLSQAYGGKRTRNKRTNERLSWCGNIIRVLGLKSDHDPGRAAMLWREWWSSTDPQYRPAPEKAADKIGAWEPPASNGWTL